MVLSSLIRCMNFWSGNLPQLPNGIWSFPCSEIEWIKYCHWSILSLRGHFCIRYNSWLSRILPITWLIFSCIHFPSAVTISATVVTWKNSLQQFIPSHAQWGTWWRTISISTLSFCLCTVGIRPVLSSICIPVSTRRLYTFVSHPISIIWY